MPVDRSRSFGAGVRIEAIKNARLVLHVGLISQSSEIMDAAFKLTER